MRRSLLMYLACPVCGGDVQLSDETLEDNDIVSGTLACDACNRAFPIVVGVPRMNVEMDELHNVARYFAYEWRAHHAGVFESNTLFGRTPQEDWNFFLDCMGVTAEDITDKVVLDAGCGSGSFTRLIGERGARVSIGVDINDAVEEAHRYCGDVESAHVVQANILALPFKRCVFDYVWCSGVLHHTPDPEAAHAALSRHVKPGGTFYVWVYAKRFNPFRLVKSILDVVSVTRLREPLLLRVSNGISYPSMALLWLYRTARRVPGLRPHGAWARRTVRPRTLAEVRLTWFDALSPMYDTRHREHEVVGWFESLGFEHIVAIEEPKVGVRGRAPANDAGTPDAAEIVA